MRIINIAKVCKAAYLMGYEGFSGVGDDLENPRDFDLSYFTETAQYSNVVAPKLRQFSGYGDGGMGTYTQDREVAIISQDDAEELSGEAGWVDGDVYQASYLFPEPVYEAWQSGVWDAVLGEEKSDYYMDLRVD